MAFDGICVSCLANEFKTTLLGGRVDRIYQPEPDEIVLIIRAGGENHRLLLGANPGNPRVYITKTAKENPASPPMFCMLLRKHLTGGKIVSVSHSGFERILDIGIESYTELGDLTVKHIIAEIMGRHSNIILADHTNRIIDSIKHVGLTISSVRSVLPGILYEKPPSQNKQNPLLALKKDIHAALSKLPGGTKADKAFVECFTGISPLAGREIAHRALGTTDVFLSELSPGQLDMLVLAAYEFFQDILCKKFSPCVIFDPKSGKIVDFSAFEPTQYRGIYRIEKKESINEALDTFYSTKDLQERLRRGIQQLSKLITNILQRCEKKLILQQEKLKETEDYEELKLKADLITANIYRIRKGQKSVVVENYYDENHPEITIELDEKLSPSANAQKFYTLYSKAKNAQKIVSEQIRQNLDEIKYLESVLLEINSAESERDLEEIRSELRAQGYMDKPKTEKAAEPAVSSPLQYSFEGYDIYVGKNNRQNDYLTLKFARPSDLWLHAKNIPGSHVIVKHRGEDIPDNVIEFAAALAAAHSKAKQSPKVEVDYTSVKNVKKPPGAKPGMVIYENYKTAYVKPYNN